jgi:hypothetical protein
MCDEADLIYRGAIVPRRNCDAKCRDECDDAPRTIPATLRFLYTVLGIVLA